MTVVDPRPGFVEQIRLHQLPTGSDDTVENFGAAGKHLGDGSGKDELAEPILGRLW
ncbi:hypothetical protein ABZ725_47755 [Streptomyces sp. NPDC006872]|uniref:hypothetical protein n=1 Tax=Streptomyces sp. NPDC006872 TaxID=3155720 RepID=UPI0033F1B29B